MLNLEINDRLFISLETGMVAAWLLLLEICFLCEDEPLPRVVGVSRVARFRVYRVR